MCFTKLTQPAIFMLTVFKFELSHNPPQPQCYGLVIKYRRIREFPADKMTLFIPCFGRLYTQDNTILLHESKTVPVQKAQQ